MQTLRAQLSTFSLADSKAQAEHVRCSANLLRPLGTGAMHPPGPPPGVPWNQQAVENQAQAWQGIGQGSVPRGKDLPTSLPKQQLIVPAAPKSPEDLPVATLSEEHLL